MAAFTNITDPLIRKAVLHVYNRRRGIVVGGKGESRLKYKETAADLLRDYGLIISPGLFKTKKASTSSLHLSSSEAEYIAASETAREVAHLRTLLAELGQSQDDPTPLCIDNETAIRMAIEEGNQGRRKHINVKHHYIRELVADGAIVLEWVPTKEQQADIMTKAPSRKQFFAQRDLVMGHAQGSTNPQQRDTQTRSHAESFG